MGSYFHPSFSLDGRQGVRNASDLLRQAGFGIREIQALFGGFDQDSAASGRWQTLAAEKISEMDALIEQTQAARAWLVDAIQRECAGAADDCVTISLDDTGNGMRVVLSCGERQNPLHIPPRL